jgi:xanthine dehydrogenase YagS FAD-binding subunit
MKNYKLAQPQTITQAAALMKQDGENRVLMAGGTDLLDELKNGIIQPDMVIDLSSVTDRPDIRQDNNTIGIGAMAKVASLAEAPLIQDYFPGLRAAALSLATPQLRNMGTIGGNLCQRPRCWYYRDPQVACRKKGGSRCFAIRGRNRYHAIFGGGMCYIVAPSDLAPALISLDAEVTIASSEGDRRMPLAEMYALPSVNVRRETVLEPGDVVKEIVIPLPKAGAKSTYLKIKERGTWDFAVVSVALNAVVVGGIFRDVRIVCGGVAPVPWRMAQAEGHLKGKRITEGLLREAAQKDLAQARPLEENAYKADLLETAVYRAGLSVLD